jgi:signal transduction histidine kinase
MTGHTTGPWFWLNPALAVAVSVALFALVFALRWFVAGVEDSIAMLYVLPVALLALTFDFRVGLAAGIAAVGLLGIWVGASGETLRPLVWLSLATPLVLLGALVGAAADRIRRANEVERHAREVALVEREAAEINDTVLQQLAATKWMLESGRTDDGIALLDATMTTARLLVTRTLGSNSVLPGPERKRADDRATAR